MANITRRITTLFEARGGNVAAVLGGVSSGYRNAGRAARSMAGDQSYLNNQLRAFGTTMRYAIAGTAVFGAAGTISTLSEIQKQLGLISAIGNVSTPQGQGLLLVGKRLDDLSKGSRQLAVETVQPIQNINDSIINLLSTVSDVPENQILPMVKDIAEASTLAQISAEDATKAFTTMQVAFGKKVNRENMLRTAQEFFLLTRRAPGGAAAGQQVITQLGQLSAASVTARVSQPQMLAMLTSVLRYGIPPAQAGRGLQFLLQTIGLPGQQTKGAREALGSLGINSNFISQKGGVSALGRIFDEVRKRGFRPGVQLTSRLSSLEEELGGDADLPKSELAGPGADFAGKIFRRVHAFRTFVALYSRWLAESEVGKPNLTQEIKDFTNAENDHVSDLEDLGKAWKRFQDEARLPQAAIALQALGQDVATTFEPIINLAARGITGAESFVSKHQKPAVYGAAGLLALLAARRGLGGILSGAGRGAGLAGGIGAASGQWAGMPGESIQNPSYVWVIGTLSGIGRAKIPGVKTIEDDVQKGGASGSRFGRFLGKAAPYSLAAGPYLGAALWAGGMAYSINSMIHPGKKPGKLLNELIAHGNIHGDSPYMQAHPGWNLVFKDYINKKIGPEQAEARLQQLTKVQMAQINATISKPLHDLARALRPHGTKGIQVHGKADVHVKVESQGADGKTKVTAGVVTVPLFTSFADQPTAKAPGSKGKSFTLPRGN